MSHKDFISWKILIILYPYDWVYFSGAVPFLYNYVTESTCGKVKHELRVQIHQLRVHIYKLRVQIHELKVHIYKLRVQIYQLWVQIHELLVQIH